MGIARLDDLEDNLVSDLVAKAPARYLDRERLGEALYDWLPDRLRELVLPAVNDSIEYWLKGLADGLITAFHSDDALRRELHTPAEADARAQLRGIIQRAKARRVVRDEADANLLFDTIVGTVVSAWSSARPRSRPTSSRNSRNISAARSAARRTVQ